MNGLVLDTNVVVSSTLYGGLALRLGALVKEASIPLFSSAPLLDELRQVLSRDKFQRKISEAGVSVDRLMELYERAVTLVEPILVPGLAPDPKDEIVIATAVAAKADFLVTGDKALLDVAEYEGGRIVSVRTTLLLIHEQTHGT